jgi:hypothetical protein
MRKIKNIGKNNKRKGNNFELQVIKKLKEIGYTGCVSSRSINKLADANKIDVIDTENKLPVNIQIKNTLNTPDYFTIESQCTDKSKPFIIIWKKTGKQGHNSPGTLALIPIEYLYQLLQNELHK